MLAMADGVGNNRWARQRLIDRAWRAILRLTDRWPN